MFVLSTRFVSNIASRIGVMTLVALVVSGCVSTDGRAPTGTAAARPAADPSIAAMYGEINDNGTVIPAVDVSKIDPKNIRQVVKDPTGQSPGTVVVDPKGRFVYLVMEGGKAMRYGAGVGKAGLEFQGTATIDRKGTWPRWAPTPNMIRREPDRYERWAKGMGGGIANPLGARALYLHKSGKDTLYRIHGTNEPDTIGDAVSSGCIRLFNQDIIDLYNRVPKDTRVVVLGSS